jgi:hypothetical protein
VADDAIAAAAVSAATMAPPPAPAPPPLDAREQRVKDASDALDAAASMRRRAEQLKLEAERDELLLRKSRAERERDAQLKELAAATMSASASAGDADTDAEGADGLAGYFEVRRADAASIWKPRGVGGGATSHHAHVRSRSLALSLAVGAWRRSGRMGGGCARRMTRAQPRSPLRIDKAGDVSNDDVATLIQNSLDAMRKRDGASSAPIGLFDRTAAKAADAINGTSLPLSAADKAFLGGNAAKDREKTPFKIEIMSTNDGGRNRINLPVSPENFTEARGGGGRGGGRGGGGWRRSRRRRTRVCTHARVGIRGKRWATRALCSPPFASTSPPPRPSSPPPRPRSCARRCCAVCRRTTGRSCCSRSRRSSRTRRSA